MLHRGFRINEHLPAALLLSLLQDPAQPRAKRCAACVALGAKTEAGVFPALVDALHEPEWELRLFALDSLRRHPRAAEAEEEMVRLLYDVDDRVRQAALRVCADLGLRSTRGPILQLLRADNPEVRDTAVNALSRLWSEEDFAPLLEIYRQDDTRSVRIAAAKTLRRRATPFTWRRVFDAFVNDREPRHRLWSCELAEEFGSGQDLRRVEPMLCDRNRNVRLAAERTVQKLSA